MGKLRVQFLAEFTRTTGSNLKSFADGWIKVFYEVGLRATRGIWFPSLGERQPYYDSNIYFSYRALLLHRVICVQASSRRSFPQGGAARLFAPFIDDSSTTHYFLAR